MPHMVYRTYIRPYLQPKLSAEDWAKINEKKEATRRGLESLKEGDVPNYWEGTAGKTFLASANQNVACQAAKELPRAEQKSDDVKSAPQESQKPEANKQPIVKPAKMTGDDAYREHIEMEKIMGYKLSVS